MAQSLNSCNALAGNWKYDETIHYVSYLITQINKLLHLFAIK